MMERLKHIPLPIWIGLALVLIVIFLVNSKQSAPQPTAGPVTSSTVGTAGQQPNAGTDQQLGNLSQTTQGGFAEVLRNQESMQREIAVLQSGDRTGLQQTATVPPANGNQWLWEMSNGNGVGTGMTQFGSNIQNSQNTSAANNATLFVNGIPVSNFQG